MKISESMSPSVSASVTSLSDHFHPEARGGQSECSADDITAIQHRVSQHLNSLALRQLSNTSKTLELQSRQIYCWTENHKDLEEH